MANYTLKLINDGIDYTLDNGQPSSKTVDIKSIGEGTKIEIPTKGSTDNTNHREITLSLHKISFHRKVYEPGRIDATIQIKVDTHANMPTIQELHNMFMRKIVQLEADSANIADDYYVHEVRPHYEKNSRISMYVDLKIYSIDNLMRINKFSEAYLGRKLREYIVTNGITDYGFNVDTFDGEKTPYSIKLSESDVLQNLSYGGVEFIQPYLVQYNETFYDFLARVCNRCGEFMYFENGELHVGLHLDKSDSTKYKKLININENKCNSIDYQNISEGVISVENYSHDSLKYEEFDNAGELRNAPEYNDNSYNIKQINDTGAYPETKTAEDGRPTKIYCDEVSNNEFFMPLYRDEFSGGLSEQYFTNNIGEYIPLGLEALSCYDIADASIHILAGLGKIELKDKIKGDKAKEDGNEIIKTWAGTEKDDDGNDIPVKMGVPFADTERHRWTTLCYYSDIKNNEESQERKMVNIDMGDAFENLRLGDVVALPYDDGNRYVVVEIGMDSETIFSKTTDGKERKTHNSNMSFSAMPLLETSGTPPDWQTTKITNVTTLEAEKMLKFFPPLLKTGAFRKSEPQHAIVIDSDDPKNQGRVRIRFPWQRKIDENMLETDDPQVKKLVKKKKNLEERRDTIKAMPSANGKSSDADKDKFKDNIKKVQGWGNDCQKETNKVQKKIDELTDTINGYNQKINNSKADKEATEARNGVIDKTIEENNKTIKENNTAIEENNTAIKENNKAIEENNKAIENNEDPNGEKKKENEKLKKENEKLTEKNKELTEKNKEPKEENEKLKKEKSENNAVIDQYHIYESEKAECERMKSYYEKEKNLYTMENDVYETLLSKLLNSDNETDDDGLIKLNTIDATLEKQFKKNTEEALEKIEKVIKYIEEELKKIAPKPMALLEAGTPWIRMVTPMATKGGGMYFKPEKGDEVMVDFENGNIERPFVVGALYSKNVCAPMKPANEFAPGEHRVIKSPNGHYIKFEDATNLTTMLSFLPVFKFMKQWDLMPSGLDIGDSDTTANEWARRIMGGITMSDGFGLCQIDISGHDRKVTVKSTIGDVEISALSGITVSAPNGNIKIEGKNIDISAGNRLTLTSGTNIYNKYKNPLSHGGIFSKGFWTNPSGGTSVESFTKHVVDEWGGGLIDVSAIRGFFEMIVKPVNGTLQIKSYSFLALEAGEGNAEIPVNNYSRKYLAYNNTPIAEKLHARGALTDNVNDEDKHMNTAKAVQALTFLFNEFKTQEYIDDAIVGAYNDACKKLAELYGINDEGKKESIFSDGLNNINLTKDEFVNNCFKYDDDNFVSLLDYNEGSESILKPILKNAYLAIRQMIRIANLEATRNENEAKNYNRMSLYHEFGSVITKLNNMKKPSNTIPDSTVFDNVKTGKAEAKKFDYYVNDDFTAKKIRFLYSQSGRCKIRQLLSYPEGPTPEINNVEFFKKYGITVNMGVTIKPNELYDDSKWSAYINSLSITVKDPTGGQIFWNKGVKKYINDKALTFLPEKEVWTKDFKGKILMSDGTQTISFKKEGEDGVSLQSAPNIIQDDINKYTESLKKLLIDSF